MHAGDTMRGTRSAVRTFAFASAAVCKMIMRVAVGSGEVGRVKHKQTRAGRAQRVQNGRFFPSWPSRGGDVRAANGDCSDDSGLDVRVEPNTASDGGASACDPGKVGDLLDKSGNVDDGEVRRGLCCDIDEE